MTRESFFFLKFDIFNRACSLLDEQDKSHRKPQFFSYTSKPRGNFCWKLKPKRASPESGIKKKLASCLFIALSGFLTQ